MPKLNDERYWMKAYAPAEDDRDEDEDESDEEADYPNCIKCPHHEEYDCDCDHPDPAR